MTDAREQLQAALGDGFSIERELERGGASRAFLATEVAIGRPVIITVVAAEQEGELFADRFAREVKFATRLQHERILPILGAGDAQGMPYYTMPTVDGPSLRERLSSETPVSLDEATQILRDVATALAYAHEQGVVHRDLKPEHVHLSSGGAVVSEFGIAKAIGASRTLEMSSDSPINVSATLTSVGSSLGSPAYMAPEQAIGSIVDQRADLYAWGMMAYELLAGAHPFAAKETQQAMIAAQLTEPPPPLDARAPDVPPMLAAIVMQCLEKDVLRRPPTAAHLLAAIEGRPLVTTRTATMHPPRAESIEPSPPPVTPAPATAPERSPSMLPLVLALLVGAAAIGWYFLAR